MVDWIEEYEINIEYIQPSKSAQNCFVERFNRTYREKALDAYIFYLLDGVRRITADFMDQYDLIRPHSSLGSLTSYEFAANFESVYLRAVQNLGT